MLAQQIVAMAVMDRWTVDEIAELVARAAPFESLGREALEGVLAMLSGAYPSDEFAELKPRIVWDRVTGDIEGRRDARIVAITSGGTIPDRGLFGVFLVGEPGQVGRRVGELDEEMVYEARVGEVITLGASSWRIEEISHDRVTVTPAPGEPGKLPFWHGDAVGRPIELGRALGAFVRQIEGDLARGARGRASAAVRLRERSDLDELAAENLLAYLEDEREAAGALPTDQRIVVQRFRDDLGDWRLCILTPFGARVHAPWALALEARLAERLGAEVQSIWSDDGIAIRLPEGDVDGIEAMLFPDADEIEDLIVAQVGKSALFASRFRENAARALLLPRRRPGQRTPLWQQRQRAADLLSVAQPVRLLPDPRRDVPRVPLGCLRRARAARAAGGDRAPRDRRSTRSRRRAPRRSRRRCCSTTSPRTCTKATRRWPSAGRRRSPWIGTCCASCSARRSCASCSIRPHWPTSSCRCSRSSRSDSRRPRISCTTCCAGSGTSRTPSWRRAPRVGPGRWTTGCAISRGRGAPSRCGSRARPGGSRWRTSARYRDAVGVQPPPGVPAAFLGPRSRRSRACSRAGRARHGPFLVRGAGGSLGAAARDRR